MKQKLQSFFSKYYLTLIIVLLLIGTLFARPFTVYSLDSDYLWHDQDFYNMILGSRISYFFFMEPKENVEIVAFSESGCFQPYEDTIPWAECPSEWRYTPAISENRYDNCFYWHVRPELMEDWGGYSKGASALFLDYTGFIVKENGKIVSASLYKMVGTTTTWCGFVDEVAVLEFPFLNEFVTETYVKSELRRIALTDRILTQNGMLNRLFAPDFAYHMRNYTFEPPYSPTYNP